MARGEKFYGDPCKRGHDGLRYLNNGTCVHCAAERHVMDRDGTFIGPPKPSPEQLRRQAATHKERLKKPRGRKAMPIPEGMTRQELMNQRRREQRAADPTYRARATEYMRRHEVKHREATRARKREWYHDNPMTRVAQRHRRRAAEQTAPGNHSAADLRLIRLLQGGHCAYCPQAEDLHVDHIVPLSRGGSNWPWNLQWLCAYHNTSKGSRTDAEYRQLIGLPVVRPASTAIWMLLLVAV